MDITCYLCDQRIQLAPIAEGHFVIVCCNCGKYIVSDVTRVLVLGLPPCHRAALSRAAKAIAAQGQELRITFQNLAQLIQPYL